MADRYRLKVTYCLIHGRRTRVFEVYDTVIRDWVAQYTYRPAARKEISLRNKEQAAIDEKANASAEASA